jgi:hypothetical protein
MLDLQSALSPGVLIFPIVLEDSVLYILVSETADDVKIDLRDKLTGARLRLQLRGQHAALAFIGKHSKATLQSTDSRSRRKSNARLCP